MSPDGPSARVRAVSARPQKDGVDGRRIYMYGEGWDYAEVENGRVGDNASQRRLAGTGIGTFNDRVREGAMGANPFGDPRTQGLLTGLFTAPNAFEEKAGAGAEEQRRRLDELTDRVLAGVSGNLADFRFPSHAGGAVVAGRDAGWPGSNCGYVAEPQETVNYVRCVHVCGKHKVPIESVNRTRSRTALNAVRPCPADKRVTPFPLFLRRPNTHEPNGAARTTTRPSSTWSC